VIAGQPVWINVVLRMGGYDQRTGPWMHFGIALFTPNLTFLNAFTWRLHETTFWAAFRSRLFAIAISADLAKG